MTKFKVGQKVKCYRPQGLTIPDGPGGADRLNGGSGFNIGYEFEINNITDAGEWSIYWPRGRAGIYEPYLKLVQTDWDE